MQKFSMKQLACAVAVAGACASANAATTDLGLLKIGLAPNVFSGFASVGQFDDVFTFTLPANGGTGYSVVDFPVSAAGVTFNTILASITLMSNADGILFNGDDSFVASATSGNGESVSLNWGPTPGGKMYLVVSGITNGSAGGLYSGGITVSPVPEPEAWAMMLIGAGLVGFRLRTRSKKTAAQRFA